MPRAGRLRSQHRGREAAFTLVEVLIALGLSAVVVGALLAFQNYQIATLRGQAKQIDLQSTTRSVVDLMARELRRSGRNPDCKPAIGGLAIATSKLLRLQTDLDGDGLLSGPNEDVTYGWADRYDTVFRVDHAQSRTDTLIEGVDLEGSGFHYFDAGGNELDASGTGLDLAQRKQVRRIRVDLAMRDEGNGTAARARASTNVDLRNRFFVADNAACAPTAVPPTLPPTPQPQSSPTPIPCVETGGACNADTECCSNKCAGKTCK